MTIRESTAMPQSDPAVDAAISDPDAVEIAGPIERLLARLDAAGVRHCHWKSNIRLSESLRGDEDLDLLVDRTHAEAFLEAASASGFKLARSSGRLGHPGVVHGFALSDDARRLLHLHAYFRVITGDSLVKSFRLPIERSLLSGEARRFGVRIPSPEVELALFTLRVLLKHVDPVEAALVGRNYDAVSAEAAWLAGRADFEAAEGHWRDWLPSAEDPSLSEAFSALGQANQRRRRASLGRRLSRALRSRRRIVSAAAVIDRWRRVAALAACRFRRRRDLRPLAGGAVVALVGPKAVGKSTLAGEIDRILGAHLDVRRVHAGKPPATALSFAPRLLVPLARRLFSAERSSEYERPERRGIGEASLLHVLRMTLLAYDRRALLRRCWRAAADGAIIIADRYPSETPGAIDGGRFNEADLAACRSPLKRWLMSCEMALSTGLPRPDLVLRLAASPATAVLRDATREKADAPDAESVMRRWAMETCAAFDGTPEVRIDTDQPLEKSAAAAVRAVWTAI